MRLRDTYMKINEAFESKTEQLRFILLMLYVFSLPYDLFYSSAILMMLGVTTLLDLSMNKLKRIPRQFYLFQLIYFLGVIGYLYSANKSQAGYLLERQLTILLLPLIIPVSFSVNHRKCSLLLASLVVTSFIAVVYLFICVIYTIKADLGLPVVPTIFSGAFFNHQFSRPLSIHAGYLSLYVSFSIFFLVFRFNHTNSLSGKAGLVTIILVLFAGLFFLASRNTIIATFLILLFVYPLFNISNKVRYISTAFVFLVACFFALSNVSYLKTRFSIELISDIKPLPEGVLVSYSNVEPRIARWKAAVDLIEDSPFIGYGTGDEIPMLKTEYIKRGLFISYLEEFNAHNQYLSYILKNGFIGLLVFLFAFYYYCQLAVRNRDFVYLSFLILLLIGFYTENILDANKGIVFFAVFNTFLGYNSLRNIKQRDQDLLKT